MIVYLIGLAHGFVAVAVAAGLLAALADRAPLRLGVWMLAGGLGLGWGLHRVAGLPGLPLDVGVVTLSAGALAALLLALSAFVRGWGALRATALGVLAVRGMMDLLDRVADASFTATSVINTDLILNSGALVAGAAAMLALAALSHHAGQAARRRDAAAVLAAVLLVQAAGWGVGAMLGLLQNGALAVSAGRVSFVARASALVPFAVYVDVALLALLGALGFRRQWSGRNPDAAASRPGRRLILAERLSEQRWLRGTAAVVGFLLVSLLYHDLYASRPPRLSPAQTVTPNAAAEIRIAIDAVKDGRLHRYAYVAADGHRVRFFLINRYDPDHTHMAVVLDACTICGDAGYIQQGDEVYCSACNVRLFLPSIGKPGGCSPIPLPHAEDGGDIVIATADLEQGAKYFSEVVASPASPQ